jgi:hypothetical protein
LVVVLRLLLKAVDDLLVEVVETLLEILLEVVLMRLVEGLLAEVLDDLLVGTLDGLLEEMLDDLLVEVLGSLLDALGTLEDKLEDVLVAILDGWVDDLLVEILSMLLDDADIEILEDVLENVLVAILDGWSDGWLVSRLLLKMPADVSLDTLVNLMALVGRTLAEVLLEDRVVDDARRLLLDVELGDLLLGARLLEDDRFDWVVDELLAGRLDVFDVDRDTPLLRRELADVLLGLVEVGSAIVTVTLFTIVTVLGGTIVIAVTAVSPAILVVVRRAVELMVLVEAW